jgi:KDO2-lipid IV(A) lauroyltransferase
MLSRLGIYVMHVVARLPLGWVRALGWALGWVLYALAVPRRRVAQTNLRLCFPDLSENQIRSITKRTFVHFAQAWMDRGWLWHGSELINRERLRLTGALGELQGSDPVVIFAPHFVGLDAGWTALTQQLPRHFTTIYTDQANKVLDS